ncbi:MAG: hypothetical protein RIT08_110, partial [Actinomycetota bacterium]
AIKRRRRRGSTQVDISSERTPESFDIDLKKRRTRIETSQADREFEEFLVNMRKRNAKLLDDINDNFGEFQINDSSSNDSRRVTSKLASKSKPKKKTSVNTKKVVKKPTKKSDQKTKKNAPLKSTPKKPKKNPKK